MPTSNSPKLQQAYTSSKWRQYKAHNGTFQYPQAWKTDFCPKDNASRLILPGSLQAQDPKIMLTMSGHASYLSCIYNQLNLEDGDYLFAQTVSSRHSETTVLENGLYLTRYGFNSTDLYRITITKQPYTAPIFTFTLDLAGLPHSKIPASYLVKRSPLTLDKKQFMQTEQYKDIVRFAESIRLDR
jgi:hypothetical protein